MIVDIKSPHLIRNKLAFFGEREKRITFNRSPTIIKLDYMDVVVTCKRPDSKDPHLLVFIESYVCVCPYCMLTKCLFCYLLTHDP